MEIPKVKPQVLVSPGLWIKIGFWFTIGAFLASTLLSGLSYLLSFLLIYSLN